PCSFAGVQPPCATGTAAAVWWKTVGMMRAMAASVSAVAETPAATRLNSCLRNLSPPERNERPRTSRILPMIEPVMEALTTPVSPFERAKSPMMSSAALPNVALRSPPTPCPRCSARCSVARPIHPARGTIARHDTTKSAVGFSSDGKYLRAMATGTNTRSQSSRGLSQERRRDGCPASDGAEGDAMSSIYHTCRCHLPTFIGLGADRSAPSFNFAAKQPTGKRGGEHLQPLGYRSLRRPSLESKVGIIPRP